MVAELPPEDDEVEDPDADAEPLPSVQMVTQPGWDGLSREDQAGIVHQIVEQVSYDGAAGKVAIIFQAAALRALLGKGGKR